MSRPLMRRLLVTSLSLLTACAGSGPVRRPAPASPPALEGASRRFPEARVVAASLGVIPFGDLAPVDVPRAPERLEEPRVEVASRDSRTEALAAAIVGRAVQLVGTARLGRVARHVPDDCSGLVRLAYQKAGIDLVSGGFLAGENAVSAIYRRAKERGALHEGEPQPGDLVFFRETYDRNRDGRRNDGLTHVAVVESLAADGTLTFIHRGRKGIARSHMNLAFPRTHRAGQGGSTLLNDILRPAARGQRAWLTGELFAGFASPGAL